MPDGKWMCQKCKWTAEIKGLTIRLSNEKVADAAKFHRVFPTHADCELRKSLGQIDFNKLRRIA